MRKINLSMMRIKKFNTRKSGTKEHSNGINSKVSSAEIIFNTTCTNLRITSCQGIALSSCSSNIKEPGTSITEDQLQLNCSVSTMLSTVAKRASWEIHPKPLDQIYGRTLIDQIKVRKSVPLLLMNSVKQKVTHGTANKCKTLRLCSGNKSAQ